MKLKFISWMQRRIQEPSAWMGVAMIAVVLGSDPLRAQGMIEAISLIVGGGLVVSGRRKMLVRLDELKKSGGRGLDEDVDPDVRTDDGREMR